MTSYSLLALRNEARGLFRGERCEKHGKPFRISLETVTLGLGDGLNYGALIATGFCANPTDRCKVTHNEAI